MSETFGQLSVGARRVDGVKKLRPKDREEWLAGRQKTIGASDLPALFGVSPWKTPLELFGEKTGRYVPEMSQTVITPTYVQLSNLDRGLMQEAPAIQMAAMARPDWSIHPNPVPGGLVFVDEAARMSSTPDAFVYCREWDGPAALQIKTVDPFAFKQTWLGDHEEPEPPLYVVIQAIADATFSGCGRAFVGAAAGWGKLHLWEVGLHPAIMAKARELVADFWQRVEDDRPYDPDYGRDGEVLAALRGEPEGREIDLTQNNRIGALVEQRDALKAKEKVGSDAAKERKALDVEIYDIMGGASRARLSDGRVLVHSIVRRGGYSVEPTQYDRLDIKDPNAPKKSKGTKAAPAALPAPSAGAMPDSF